MRGVQCFIGGEGIDVLVEAMLRLGRWRNCPGEV